jgi:hypothetical protein
MALDGAAAQSPAPFAHPGVRASRSDQAHVELVRWYTVAATRVLEPKDFTVMLQLLEHREVR